MKEILENVRELCKNQSGNYVIQHVLLHGLPQHRTAVIQSLRGSILALSRHKFASNVVEKCISSASRQDRELLIDEMVGRDEDAEPPLLAMVKDQFGNYVVQRLIDVADDAQRVRLFDKIRPYSAILRTVPYGKHIVTKMERLSGKPVNQKQ